MQTALILSVLAPLLVATALVAFGHRLWRKNGPVGSGRWSLALAPALAAFAAYWAVRGTPELPPSDASEWALWMGAVAALVGVVDGRRPLPSAPRLGLHALLAIATAYMILRPLVRFSWGSGEALAWVGGGAIVLWGLWEAIERMAVDRPGSTVPAACLAWGFGVATVLGISGSALLAQAAGGVVVAFGVMVIAGLLRPELRLDRSAVGPAVLIFGGLVLSGLHYAEVGGPSALFLVLAPLTLALGRVLPVPERGWKAALGQGVLALVVSGAAIGLAAAPDVVPETEDDSTGYDDDYGY